MDDQTHELMTDRQATMSLQVHRRKAIREGIASATIEDGTVSSGAQDIMQLWAQGLLAEEDAIERIKALHASAPSSASGQSQLR